MREIDHLPFIFAAVLFLLAWLLGFPMRAQSAPLKEVEYRVIPDSEGGEMLCREGACDQLFGFTSRLRCSNQTR
jgi:beta-lactamase class D